LTGSDFFSIYLGMFDQGTNRQEPYFEKDMPVELGMHLPRVLHIDSEFGWRGGQQQVVYLLTGLQRDGVPSTLICQPGSELQRCCLERGLPHIALRMRGELDPLAAFRISRMVAEQKIHLLHLHSAHAVSMGLWVRLFSPRVKLIAVRRVDFQIRKNRLSRWKYDNSLLDRIVCISEGVRRVLLEDGLSPERCTIIHSGVDVDKFEEVVVPPDLRKRWGIPEDHLLVGTVAAIAGHKDYPNLLNAARKVLDRKERVSFLALGSGPDEEAVHRMAADLGLGSRFVFAGFQKEVGGFLKAFDLFVLASHLEGLGTSILDAQAAGLPVIACRTGGIPEAVQDRINGLLVPPRDSGALAGAILDLVDHPESRRAYGAAGRETVFRFSVEKMIHGNKAMYRELTRSS
jgi:L-malate glycosyltransferase